MDALPLINDLGIPLRIGFDDMFAVPIFGDLICGLISTYQIYLTSLLGPSKSTMIKMVSG